MARDRRSHVGGKEGTAEAVAPALPVSAPRATSEVDEHHERMRLFIRALARDLARLDHAREGC